MRLVAISLLLSLLGIRCLEVEATKAGAEPYINDFGLECIIGANCEPNGCYFPAMGLCKNCKTGYVPINGTCHLVTDQAVRDAGCKGLNGGTPDKYCSSCSGDYFLFYGDCNHPKAILGAAFCEKAENGVCTKCGFTTFTNPDKSAVEKCIMCADTVGFGIYHGKKDCRACVPPSVSDPIASCVSCYRSNVVPIDEQCVPPGDNTCTDTLGCTECVTPYIRYNRECLTGTGDVATTRVCTLDNQYTFGNKIYCKKCINTEYYPIDGVCAHAGFDTESLCTQKEDGVCKACDPGNTGDVFLFYGSCYRTSTDFGRNFCASAADGACEAWVAKEDMFVLGGGYYFCNDTSYGGVKGCLKCHPLQDWAICDECSTAYIGLEYRTCVDECLEHQVLDGNICVCEEGYVPSHNRLMCEKERTCRPTAENCLECNRAGECEICVDSSYSITFDGYNCVETCPTDMHSVDGRCVCIKEFDPVKNACKPVVDPKRQEMIQNIKISSIVIGVVVIIGIVIGILAWKILSKRGHKAPKTKQLHKRMKKGYLNVYKDTINIPSSSNMSLPITLSPSFL